jgi:hypothetical protein
MLIIKCVSDRNYFDRVSDRIYRRASEYDVKVLKQNLYKEETKLQMLYKELGYTYVEKQVKELIKE